MPLEARACASCRRPFMPEARDQRTCSFRCARDLVPKDAADDEGVPHPKREQRLARGWVPKPLARDVNPTRSRRIAEALAELRETNARRLRS